MGVLKLVGYIVAAIAVLTALFTGAMFVVVIGIVGGFLLDFIGAVILTAYSLKSYFASDEKRSDLD